MTTRAFYGCYSRFFTIAQLFILIEFHIIFSGANHPNRAALLSFLCSYIYAQRCIDKIHLLLNCLQ
jgi:hypothetical protein